MSNLKPGLLNPNQHFWALNLISVINNFCNYHIKITLYSKVYSKDSNYAIYGIVLVMYVLLVNSLWLTFK